MTRSTHASPQRGVRRSGAQRCARTSLAQCRSVPRAVASSGFCVLGEPTRPIARRDRDARPGGAKRTSPRIRRWPRPSRLHDALDASAAAGEDASRVTELRTMLPLPGVRNKKACALRSSVRPFSLDLLTSNDGAVRRAAKKLALRPFEPPHPPAKASRTGRAQGSRARSNASASGTRLAARLAKSKNDRTTALALGPLVEAFFRKEENELEAIVIAQQDSRDAIVRECSERVRRRALHVEDSARARARAAARNRAPCGAHGREADQGVAERARSAHQEDRGARRFLAEMRPIRSPRPSRAKRRSSRLRSSAIVRSCLDWWRAQSRAIRARVDMPRSAARSAGHRFLSSRSSNVSLSGIVSWRPPSCVRSLRSMHRARRMHCARFFRRTRCRPGVRASSAASS